MASRLIVMLTLNDRTVTNASEIFTTCQDLPVEYWGFKDMGLPEKKMQLLASQMKSKGKQAILELVSLDEESCMRGSKLAVRCGFNYLAGGQYSESVAKILAQAGIKYLPFCGKVAGPPIVISGTEDQVLQHAISLQRKGVDGIDLAAFRFQGDGGALAARMIGELKIPVIMAGSISSFARLDAVLGLKPWAFTIGSGLFEGKFGKGDSFREQLEHVVNYLTDMERSR